MRVILRKCWIAAGEIPCLSTVLDLLFLAITLGRRQHMHPSQMFWCINIAGCPLHYINSLRWRLLLNYCVVSFPSCYSVCTGPKVAVQPSNLFFWIIISHTLLFLLCNCFQSFTATLVLNQSWKTGLSECLGCKSNTKSMCPLKDGLKNDTTFQISDSEKQRKISQKFWMRATLFYLRRRMRVGKGLRMPAAKNSVFCLHTPAKTVSSECSFCSSGLIILLLVWFRLEIPFPRYLESRATHTARSAGLHAWMTAC